MLLKGGGMEKEDAFDVVEMIMSFLKTGGYKGTRIIHDHLKQNKIKMSRVRLLSILHTYAEPGEYVSIGGIRQKSWIA
jgi:hypothetical protein